MIPLLKTVREVQLEHELALARREAWEARMEGGASLAQPFTPSDPTRSVPFPPPRQLVLAQCWMVGAKDPYNAVQIIGEAYSGDKMKFGIANYIAAEELRYLRKQDSLAYLAHLHERVVRIIVKELEQP